MNDVRPMDEAKHPVTVLAGPYGHPLHPMLVAVPIGAWIASIVFDLASRVVDDPQFLYQGSRWLIGIGVLGALAAAAVGFLDLLAIPRRTRAYRVALLHMSINLLVTAAYAVNFAIRDSGAAGSAGSAGTAGTAGTVGWGPLALSAACLAGLSVAGYLGGELAFRYGVRVATEDTQAEGYQSTRQTEDVS